MKMVLIKKSVGLPIKDTLVIGTIIVKAVLGFNTMEMEINTKEGGNKIKGPVKVLTGFMKEKISYFFSNIMIG